MADNSIVNDRVIKSRGFSLLEVIFVLAFLGIILLTVGNYVRKLIDEKNRQTAADAVVQEIYGVLQFVNADSIETFKSNNYGSNVADRGMKKVTNPLYQSAGVAVYPEPKTDVDTALTGLTNNPIWLAHPQHNEASLIASNGAVSPYIARNYSTGITNIINNDIVINDNGKANYSHSLKWSQAIWGNGSVRGYFTDSGCQSGVSATNINAIYFSQQFLSCNENPVLKNSEIGIPRIDLVNKEGSFDRRRDAPEHSVSVDRVDVYVSFSPVDGNSARIAQFITPLTDAFRVRKIMPNTDNIFLVTRIDAGTNDNAWALLNKKNGLSVGNNVPVSDFATLSDLPDMVGKLQKGRTYAIRFTFDGKGDYLRTDGVNAATKVCWNTTDSMAGPCITSTSQDTLVLKRRDNSREFANLQVNSVISKGSYMDNAGNIQPEYYTAPRIQYAAFSNTGANLGPYYKNDKDKMCTTSGGCTAGPAPELVSDTANGAIPVPVQTCPGFDEITNTGATVRRRLHPRLNVAVSSVVSGIPKQHGNKVDLDIKNRNVFSKLGHGITELTSDNNRSNISINSLGGAVLQVIRAGDEWRIAGMVASEDIGINGDDWIYFNPPWLSVMITTWCSSVPQN